MEKIANVKNLKRGESINFHFKGKEAILVKTKQDKLVAYSRVCPHEGGSIVWDESINKLLCECHLSIFNIDDGTVYKYSSVFDKMNNLTPIELKIDNNQDIYAVGMSRGRIDERGQNWNIDSIPFFSGNGIEAPFVNGFRQAVSAACALCFDRYGGFLPEGFLEGFE